MLSVGWSIATFFRVLPSAPAALSDASTDQSPRAIRPRMLIAQDSPAMAEPPGFVVSPVVKPPGFFTLVNRKPAGPAAQPIARRNAAAITNATTFFISFSSSPSVRDLCSPPSPVMGEVERHGGLRTRPEYHPCDPLVRVPFPRPNGRL